MTALVDGDFADPTWISHVINGLADAEVAAAAAGTDQGSWFDGFVGLIELAIEGVDGLLGGGSYGLAIILFTLLIKLFTFPLTYQQMESTTKMQILQPQIKAVQAKFKSNPEVMQREMALLYQENELNPLAGCLPSLVQLPIFIGLYRALQKLATDNLLNEPFLWLPNLEGPVYGTQSNGWLLDFSKWDGGAPPLGWHDTLCFLTLPAILIVSQTISQKLISPPKPENPDPSQELSQQIIGYLPFMIGFFSLSVPSGLAVYWITNNFVTTASNILIKNQVNSQLAPAGGGATAVPASASSFSVVESASSPVVVDADIVGSPAAEVMESSEVIEATPLRPVEGFGAPDAEDSDDPFARKKPKSSKKGKKGKKGKR